MLTVLRPGLAAWPRRVAVYCWVTSAGQPDDLASQVAAMESFSAGRDLAVSEWICEVGAGMNFRRQFIRLFDQVVAGGVSMIVVAHRDRLARFGFELVEWLATKHGCDFVVANQETLSPTTRAGRRSGGDRACVLVPLVWARPLRGSAARRRSRLSLASDTVPA